jgi:hypothetical protein
MGYFPGLLVVKFTKGASDPLVHFPAKFLGSGTWFDVDYGAGHFRQENIRIHKEYIHLDLLSNPGLTVFAEEGDAAFADIDDMADDGGFRIGKGGYGTFDRVSFRASSFRIFHDNGSELSLYCSPEQDTSNHTLAFPDFQLFPTSMVMIPACRLCSRYQ